MSQVMGDWRSGSATALQAVGRGFKSLIAHHEFLDQASPPGLFLSLPREFLKALLHFHD